jgi:transcriptional regulator with GAF, ATPase, and Fis domain
VVDEMDQTRPVAEVLADFAQILAEDHTAEDILARLGDACAALLPVDGVGVLLRQDDGGLMMATSNSELGRVVERLEVELGEGPCTEAIERGERVVVPDLGAARDQYPRFAPRALEAGAVAIHALPMSVRTEVFGAVDLVAAQTGRYGERQLATAQLLADVAASYLANCQVLTERSNLAEQLQQALDSRVVIEQAKGMMAGRHGIGPEEAFERIRAHARAARAPVKRVASEVLRGELDP